AAPEVLAEGSEPQLAPQDRRSDFHFRGDPRALLTQVASTYGIDCTFDDSVSSRRVRFDIENVDFYTAMRAAAAVTKTFRTVLDAKQILVAADTPENHRSFDRMALRTFRFPDVSTPQELNDVINVMRSVFDIRFISQQPQSGTVAVRAPRDVLEAATRFVEGLDADRPEVMVEVRAYEIRRPFTRNMALQIPNQ